MTGLVVHIGVNSERNDGETLTNLPSLRQVDFRAYRLKADTIVPLIGSFDSDTH
ncbi:hypothetical protein VFA_003334 [Vibrio furnissii CIP 102972]|nr:hypothetical protein VFA_003334 [Vibrio furnissii CIP 102972]